MIIEDFSLEPFNIRNNESSPEAASSTVKIFPSAIKRPAINADGNNAVEEGSTTKLVIPSLYINE